MLVNDIAKNRVRVREIVRRFNQAGNDSKSRLWIIKQLAKEELLLYCNWFELIIILKTATVYNWFELCELIVILKTGTVYN